MIPKRALVIGGSGSLGRVVCRTLVEKGFHLAFSYNTNEEVAHSLADELNAQTFKLDLTEVDEVRSVCRELPCVDALVICSGLATAQERDGQPHVPEFLEITEDSFDTMVSVNVRGTLFACQEVARSMIENGGGRIVIVGSIDGVKPLPAPPDYACCKAALAGLSQAMAKELGKHGILVNMLAPGILEGGMADLLSDDLMEEYLKHNTLRRVGTFQEVANAIAYLVSEKNTYLTAQNMILDGGI